MKNKELEFDHKTEMLLAFFETDKLVAKVVERQDTTGYTYVKVENADGIIKCPPEEQEKLQAYNNVSE